MKKLLALVMAIMLALSFASFASAEDLEYCEFDWYIGSNPPNEADLQMVEDAINAYILPLINAKVDITYMTSNDWVETMGTMLTSGDDIGIVGFGSQSKSDYVIESQRGAYYPLTDLFAEYAPGTYSLFPESVWEGMKINGEIYGIPSMKDNGYFISCIYNSDMIDEMGIDITEYQHSNFRELEDLFYEVKEWRDENYPEMAEYPVAYANNLIYPYNFAFETFLNDSYLAVCNIEGIMDIAGVDCNTVVNFYDTPEFLEFCLQKQRLVADGIYLWDETDTSELRKAANGIAFSTGWGYVLAPSWSPAYNTGLMMADVIWTERNNYFSAGTAISANCKNPERALMFLELVNTDPFVATTMRFGVEGIHWVKDDEGKMTFDFEGGRNADPTNRGYYYWYNAPVGNLTIVNAPEEQAGPDNYLIKEIKKLNDACIVPTHFDFVFDTTPVVNEVAACTSIVLEYQNDLVNGRCESPEAVEAIVAEFRQKLADNGAAKIVEEVQRQIDVYMESK